MADKRGVQVYAKMLDASYIVVTNTGSPIMSIAVLPFTLMMQFSKRPIFLFRSTHFVVLFGQGGEQGTMNQKFLAFP